MQFQKLNNVNTPIEQLLVLHNTRFDAIRFGLRKENGYFHVASSYKKGHLTGKITKMRYQEFLALYGMDYFWCIYHKPCQ